MKSGYETLADWEKDLAIFQANPDDTKFLQHIVSKVNVSEDMLKLAIQERIQGDMMLSDPWRFFKIYMKTQPKEYSLITKSHEDPWFEV